MFNPKDSVEYFTGARGSGKSSMMQRRTLEAERALVFSPLEETDKYGELLGVAPCRTLDEFVRAAASGAHAVYAVDNPTPERFDLWCKIVWFTRDCLAVVEELADVSYPGKARGWWGMLLRKSRHRRVDIIASTQRPTEVDSSIRGNASRIVCLRLSKFSDCKLMADEIGVDVHEIASLSNLQYFDHDKLTGSTKRGQIVFE